MKTKIVFLLIVLFTISAQAQIPTLAEKNYKSTNKKKSYIYNEKAENINSLTLNEEKFIDGSDISEFSQSKIDSLKENIKILKEVIDSITKKEDIELNKNSRNYLLYSNVYLIKFYKEKYQNNIDVKLKKIDSLIKNMQSNVGIDELENTKKRILNLKKDVLNSNKKLKNELKKLLYRKTSLFPSLQSNYGTDFFKEYYSNNPNTSYLNSLALNYSDLGTVIQSELIADTFGAVRIGFGTTVQSNSDTPESELDKKEQIKEDQLESLLNGGGNFYLETILPLYSSNENNFTVFGYLNNKIGLGLKGFNDAIDTSTFNTSFGCNLYMGLNSDEKSFNVFLQSDLNYVIASESIYNNLQLTEKKPFIQGKLIVGLTFLSKFRLAATLNSFGSDDAVRTGKVVVGLQIIPNK